MKEIALAGGGGGGGGAKRIATCSFVRYVFIRNCILSGSLSTGYAYHPEFGLR